MSIEFTLIDNDPSSCTNNGPACEACPQFEYCPNHEDDDNA